MVECGATYTAGRLAGRICRKQKGHAGRHAETTKELEARPFSTDAAEREREQGDGEVTVEEMEAEARS